MATYTFQVRFLMPEIASLEHHIDALNAAGCADAAFCGPSARGEFVGDFDRCAPDAETAIKSALEDVRLALPRAHIVGVENQGA